MGVFLLRIQFWIVITQRQYVPESLIRILCLVQCFLHVIVYLVSLLLVDDNVDVHILHYAQQKSRPLRAAIVISVILLSAICISTHDLPYTV